MRKAGINTFKIKYKKAVFLAWLFIETIKLHIVLQKLKRPY